MPLTQERLVELLNEIGLHHWVSQEDNGGIAVPFSIKGVTLPSVLVHVRVDPAGLVFYAMITQFLRVPDDHPHVDLLMQALLHESYVTSLGQWERDPSDGEVRVTVQLPLFGREPTARQVARVIGAAGQLAQRGWPRFLSILETGYDPELDKFNPDLAKKSRDRELLRLQLRMQQLISSMPPKVSNKGGTN